MSLNKEITKLLQECLYKRFSIEILSVSRYATSAWEVGLYIFCWTVNICKNLTKARVVQIGTVLGFVCKKFSPFYVAKLSLQSNRCPMERFLFKLARWFWQVSLMCHSPSTGWFLNLSIITIEPILEGILGKVEISSENRCTANLKSRYVFGGRISRGQTKEFEKNWPWVYLFGDEWH